MLFEKGSPELRKKPASEEVIQNRCGHQGTLRLISEAIGNFPPVFFSENGTNRSKKGVYLSFSKGECGGKNDDLVPKNCSIHSNYQDF